MKTFVKDPNALLDYTFDWSDWLGDDTILSVTATLATGLTQENLTSSSTAATVWISGGEAGKSYDVTCEITTNGGRTDRRTITLRVVDR